MWFISFFQLCFGFKENEGHLSRKIFMWASINHWLTVIPMNLLTTVTQLFWRQAAPFINRLHTPQNILTVSPFSRNVLLVITVLSPTSGQSRLVAPPPPAPRVGHFPSWHTTVKLWTPRQGSWLERILILMEVTLQSFIQIKSSLPATHRLRDWSQFAEINCIFYILPGTRMWLDAWSGYWGEFCVARSIATSVVPSVLVRGDKNQVLISNFLKPL